MTRSRPSIPRCSSCEQQGFTVERAANGDDALALLRRQPYGVVLLDEQMPGTRGLDLVPQLRAVDAGMPVVMVTKSEEPETLRDAIGAEISDYLTKPVNPRQVLSVVLRLVEGDRIRQQRLSRDFVTRFRDLEGRRGEVLAWREWVELVAELGAMGGAGSGAADEPGLQEALRTLQSAMRHDFARFVAAAYPRWLAERGADRPPLSVDVVSEFVRPTLEAHGRVMLVVVDCLRLDQWAMIRPLVERVLRHRGRPLLLDPADRHAVQPQRDLLGALPGGDGRAASRTGGTNTRRRRSTRTRPRCSASSCATSPGTTSRCSTRRSSPPPMARRCCKPPLGRTLPATASLRWCSTSSTS